MNEYLTKFANHSVYQAAESSLLKPNVSYCTQENEVHYNPLPFFCKLTLTNGTVVELEGSGELTNQMTTDYISSIIRAEIGTLCTSIGSAAFYNCSSLTSVTIPNSVTSIGNMAFRSTGLKKVIIPDSVTVIVSAAFEGCSNLSEVILNENLTNIGGNAFNICGQLTNITIPSTVNNIGADAFSNCSNLVSVTVKATTPPTLYMNGPFNNNASGRQIYVPSASLNDYKTANRWSNYANDIYAIS